MAKNVEEYIFSLLKRRKLINMLNESGFIVDGIHVYIAKPKEGDAKILGNYLPIAVIRRFFYKPVNLDEPSLKDAHDKMREIYLSVVN